MRGRKRRLTRHEMQIEIRMLTTERNFALWERDRLKKTVDDLLGAMELSTSGLLIAAQEIVEQTHRRDGDASDAPASSAMDDSWFRT